MSWAGSEDGFPADSSTQDPDWKATSQDLSSSGGYKTSTKLCNLFTGCATFDLDHNPIIYDQDIHDQDIHDQDIHDQDIHDQDFHNQDIDDQDFGDQDFHDLDFNDLDEAAFGLNGNEARSVVSGGELAENTERQLPQGGERGRGHGGRRGQGRGRGRGTHPEVPDLQDPDLQDPEEFLSSKRNRNTVRNEKFGVDTYNRVMTAYNNKVGSEFVSLQDGTASQLRDALMKFFQIARRSDNSVYSSNTLHTIFNGVTSYLGRREDAINVKKDIMFTKVRSMVATSSRSSAEAGRGPGVNSKRAIKTEHLQLAIEAGTIGRSSPEALVTFTYLAATIGWGCRAKEEVHMIQNKDVIFGPPGKGGVSEWIELAERVTKTRTGRPGDERDLEAKVFPDHKHPELCYVRTITKYWNKKTPQQKNPEGPFFQTVKQSAALNPEGQEYWYTGKGTGNSGAMGVNVLGNLAIKALKDVGVDCKLERYSGISTRKCQMQLGIDAGVPDIHLSRLAGHKSVISKKDYISSKGNAHKAGQLAISRRSAGLKGQNYEEEFRELEESDDRMKSRGETKEPEQSGSMVRADQSEQQTRGRSKNRDVETSYDRSSDEGDSRFSEKRSKSRNDKRSRERRDWSEEEGRNFRNNSRRRNRSTASRKTSRYVDKFCSGGFGW